MKERKIKESELQKRRLELLKKYYPVDEEKKIITVKLYYEHASELLDYSVGEEGREMFSEEFLEKVTEIFKRIPFGYKVDVQLEIKDYDVYNEEVIMEKFNDFLEINSFDVVQYGKKNNFIASGLFLVGLMLLILNGVLSGAGVYGEDTSLEYMVIKEFFDITSWVFIWQAVTVLFLSPSDSGIYILAVTRKMNSLGIVKDGVVKIKEDRNSILDKCMMDSKRDKVSGYMLLVSSVLLIFLGAVSVLSPFLTIMNAQGTEGFSISTYVVEIIGACAMGALLILAGVLGISKFSNKNISLKAIFPIVVIDFVVIVLIWMVCIVGVIMNMSTLRQLLNATAEVVVFAAYIISYSHAKKYRSQ